MIPLPYPAALQTIPAPRPGALLRELAVRQDRLPQDERIDLPEIQESFRVSFSDEARAASTCANRSARSVTRSRK